MYSQDFNPYTYTHNNPLSFIDPSGYWDEACDIGGASDPGYNLIDYTIELPEVVVTNPPVAYTVDLPTLVIRGNGNGKIYSMGHGMDKQGDGGVKSKKDKSSGGQNSGSSGMGYTLAFYNDINSYSGPDDFVHNPSYYNNYEINTNYSYTTSPDPVQNVDATEAVKMARGKKDEELTLSETGIMANAMGVFFEVQNRLINWGLRQATTPWGNSIRGFNKFSKGAGTSIGYYSAFVYGIQARNAYKNGDRLLTLSNGMMSFYTIVATKGGSPGLVFAAPFIFIDWTVGMDNFLLFNFNYGIEQSNQIEKGNLGVAMWRPGHGLR